MLRLNKNNIRTSIIVVLIFTCIIIIYVDRLDLKSSKATAQIEPNELTSSQSNLESACKIALISKWSNETFIQWLFNSLQADADFKLDCKLKAFSLDHLNSLATQITKINEDQQEQLRDFKSILINFVPNRLMLKLAKLLEKISLKIKVFYLLNFNLSETKSIERLELIRSLVESEKSYLLVTNRNDYLTLKYSYGINFEKLILISSQKNKNVLNRYKNLFKDFKLDLKDIVSNESLIPSSENIYLNNSNLKQFIKNNLFQMFCLYADNNVQINIHIDSSINVVSFGVVSRSLYVLADIVSGINGFNYSNMNSINFNNEFTFETVNLNFKITLIKNSLTIKFFKVNKLFYGYGILATAFKELTEKPWNQISLKIAYVELIKFKLKENDIFSHKSEIQTSGDANIFKWFTFKSDALVNFMIEGPAFSFNSFAVVNRKLFLSLYASARVNVLLKSEETSPCEGENDFEMILVYHFYLQQQMNSDLKLIFLRNSGIFVTKINWSKPKLSFNLSQSQIFLIHHQPWEFHATPIDWIRYFNEVPDEVWVPSTYNRLAYIKNGVYSNKTYVIPHGIFDNQFKQNINLFSSKKKFKFLTIGGMIERKGIDLILDSYSSLFTSKDDVSLIIHSIYGDNYALDKLNSIQNNTNSPEIVYLKTKLSSNEITGLFKTVNVYLSPYRSEGFGLTILEAMSNGIVPIVTRYGPSLEYCSSKCCYFIDAVETDCHVYPCGNMSIFNFKTNYQPKWSEPNISKLKETMMNVYLNRNELKKRNNECKLDSLKFTWEKVAEKVLKRIVEINT